MNHSNRWLRYMLLLALIATLSLPLSSTQAQDETPVEEGEITAAFVPGQLIIAFQPWVTEDEVLAFYDEYDLTEMDDLSQANAEEDAALVLAFVPADVTSNLVDGLERDPRVRFAEPNFILQIAKEPDDPDWERLWGLHNTGQTGGSADADIDALEGWDVNTGSDKVIVVVIDSGIDYTHEDLVDNLWKNPGECPGGICEKNGVDDDGNGYVDDFYGINSITDSGDPMDDYGHGTHVAGTIGAKGNNGIGIAGVNWDVQIMGCKFLGLSGGGTVASAVKCFNYVNQMKNEHNQNIVATNNSWGGGASQALMEAMAGPDQPLHVCAAGNGGSDAPHYPAAFDLENIISVAATDHNDMYAEFSNWGATVDLAAPGDEIYSTVPTGNCPVCDPSGYSEMSGTSMAAPHVAGAAALIAAEYPSLTPLQIKQRILTGVDPLTDEQILTVTDGRLNLLNSLEDDDIAPAAVNDLAATKFFMTQVELKWSATGDDGMAGRANKYDVRYSTSPISPDNWDSAVQAKDAPIPGEPGDKEEFTVAGLEPGNTYYFALRVLDNVGNASELSNIVIGKTTQGTIVFEDDVENGAGEWEIVGADALWHISDNRANSPKNSWYYGDEDTRTYNTGAHTQGMLVSPEIVITKNEDVLLQFYEWSELESSAAYDRTRVQMTADSGKSWTTVFESHGTDDKWEKRAVSLTPYMGDSSAIQVRFWFDSIDDRFNSFEGWYVDDIMVMEATPGLPGAGPEQPNLFIQDENIGLSRDSAVSGDHVIVTALVMNNGSADAEDVRVQFREVGEETSTPIGLPQTIASIGVGGNGTAQIVYEVQGEAGERTIQVVVDPMNLIPESNESDNEASRTFEVAERQAANLVVLDENISFSVHKPSPGEQVVVRAIVVNNGARQAADIAVQFVDATDSGATTPIGESQVIDLLGPGESAVVEVSYDTSGPAEDRTINVIVDPRNAVQETNKDDNEASAKLEMMTPPLPNLSVDRDDIGFDPMQPVHGDTVTVRATIINDGELTAHNVVVQFADATGDLSSPIGEFQTIDAIPPGSSAVAQVEYATRSRSGERKIEVKVDPQNLIAESSESDNDATATLTVTPPPMPNLVMESTNIGLSPLHPMQGEIVTIRAAVLNNGSLDAHDVIVQFLDVTDDDATPIGEKQVIAVAPAGGSAVAEMVYDTTGLSGSRTIEVSVDPNNYIPESNEDDNSAIRALSVALADQPNLSMLASNITFEPPIATEGDEVTIRAVVLNNGGVDAENVLVQFVDVSNGGFTPIGTEQTLESVAAGGSSAAQVMYETAGKVGNRRIQVLVDSNNLVAESDENDNDALSSLMVEAPPLPNLVVRASGIGFNPSNPVDGDQVTVNVLVQNDGDVDASDVTVQILDVSGGESTPVASVQTIASIAAGSVGVVEVDYDVSGKAGERQLRVLVDPSNFIAESDETDNRATTILQVAEKAAPNLVVLNSNVGVSPLSPLEGDQVTLTLTLLNNGSADASDILIQFVDATDGGAEPIGSKQTIETLAAGESALTSVVYDSAGKSGERRIRVVADPHMTIVETSEMDNEAVIVLDVAAAHLPNLVVNEANIGFSDVSPEPGQTITVTATILNDGSADVEQVVVQFVDATFAEGAPIGASQVISGIPSGGAGVAQILYSSMVAGDHKIQVIADPNNLVRESDENDNRAIGTVTVQALPLANLTVNSSSIGFDPAVIAPDDKAVIHVTVRNSGGVTAAAVDVQFLDVTGEGAAPIGEVQYIASIEAGGSAVATVEYDAAQYAGGAAIDREIQVVVNPNRTIVESSTSDNRATATLEVFKQPLANLVILDENITFSDPAPVDGDSVTVFALVQNNGTADASDVMVQFVDESADGAPIGPQQAVPSIPAGGSAVVKVMYDTSGKAGERNIVVKADPNNFVPETSTSDNTGSSMLDVRATALPNLVVNANNIGLKPPAPTDGDRVRVQTAVLNHGASVARDVSVQVMDVSEGNPAPVGAPQVIPRIAAGGSGSVVVLYDTSGLEGERLLQVTVDPNNFIRESNEEDNSAEKVIVVAPPPAPNLVALASNLDFEPADPLDGDLVSIRATVINNGDEQASDIVVQLSDVTDGEPVLIGSARLIDGLLAFESATVEVTYDTTDRQGDRRIQMLIDPNDTIPESNETDNKAVAMLFVAPPPAPNLVMKESNISFSPSQPTDGVEVTIRATVLNEGMLDAGAIEVAFYDVTNGNSIEIGTKQRINGIAAGSSGLAEVTYDTTGKEGVRVIRIVVDPNELIDEMNEADNEAERELTVLPKLEEPVELPNLAVTEDAIAFDPVSPTPGDVVTVTVTVSNTGSVEAQDVVVRFLDETDPEPVQIGEDQMVSVISGGSIVTASVAYDTTGLSGDRTITVIVDPDGAIDESNEDDNSASATLSLNGDTEAMEPLPNLVVLIEDGGRAVSMEDGVLTVAAVIHNAGTDDARDVKVVFAADPSAAVIPLDGPFVTPVLMAGAEMRVEARYGADGGAGLYSFRVIADPDNVVRESSENDNEARAEIQLP